MIDTNSFNLLGLAATGGVMAAVIAGWQHVKGFSRYLLGFMVTTTHLSNLIAEAALPYLMCNWKQLPKVELAYVGKFYTLRNETATATKQSISRIVPFLGLPLKAVFYTRGNVVLLSREGSNITVYGIRFLFDPEDFIKQAIMWLEKDAFQNKKRDRHFLETVTGTDKYGERGTLNRASSIDSTEDVSEQNGNKFDLNFRCCTSFMYRREQYVWDNSDDPFAHLYFDDSVMKYVEQAEQWFTMGDWYSERSIPWRRGWLLYGPGGTGKSSLMKAVAQHLGIPIYVYEMSTLSNSEFKEAWGRMNVPCMALFEDFDNVFDGRKNTTHHQSLTFDTVLNVISGVETVNGVFLGINTNNLEKIDPALGNDSELGNLSSRPGRIDCVIRVGYMSNENRLKMARHILRDWPSLIDQLVDSYRDIDLTPVQFQELCIQEAYAQLNKGHVHEKASPQIESHPQDNAECRNQTVGETV